MDPQDTFITRLRRHRERHHVSLDDMAAATRIKRELLEAFERNDLSRWPRGLYARAWVRAYATVVGLDPLDTVDEFCRLFPQGNRRTGSTLQEMAGIVAHPSEYRDEFSHDGDRRRSNTGERRSPRINVLPAPAWPAALRRAAYALWMRAVARLTLAAPRLKRPARTGSSL